MQKLDHVRWWIAAASTLVVLPPSFAQAPRLWSKGSYVLTVDGQQHAEWRDIATSDQQLPFLMRNLYQDNEGSRLVLRTEYRQDPSPHTTITIEMLGSSELLTFAKDAAAESLTIRFGELETTLYHADAVAEFGPNGTSLPEAARTQSRVMIGAASREFQDALRRLAMVGCYESSLIFPMAVLFAHLFYDDVDCTTIPKEKASSPLDRVPIFDPNQLSPDSFEERFGAAYFE